MSKHSRQQLLHGRGESSRNRLQRGARELVDVGLRLRRRGLIIVATRCCRTLAERAGDARQDVDEDAVGNGADTSGSSRRRAHFAALRTGASRGRRD